jgi:hypothetical protein
LALKHAGKIQAYIKDFTGLMLEIKYMSKEEKLLQFMNGLQSWAQNELRCQNMQTLATTITTIRKLLDFQDEPKTGPRNNEETQCEKQQQEKGKKKDKGKTKMSKGIEDNTKQRNVAKEKKLISYWICANEPYVENCPLKQKLNALEKEDNSSVGVLQVVNVVM